MNTRSIAFSLIALTLSGVTSASPRVEPLAFKVWLDDRPIGRHQFDISTQDNKTFVTSNVQLKLKILFATLFSYEHEATEIWQGECLTSIQSDTSTNGDDVTLEGFIANDRFVVIATDDDGKPVESRVDECIGTYAYWDLERLERSLLMNAQTGRLSEAALRVVGPAQLPRTSAVATQYKLSTDEADIHLWYDEDGRWLGLRTLTNGRTLVYINESIIQSS